MLNEEDKEILKAYPMLTASTFIVGFILMLLIENIVIFFMSRSFIVLISDFSFWDFDNCIGTLLFCICYSIYKII